MTSNSIAYLRFESIKKKFAGQNFFSSDNISFEIQKGQIHVLVGENGVGKSTIMNLLIGLYPKDSGNIYLHGKRIDIRSPQDAKKYKIGMVHQHFQLASNIKAIDHFLLDNSLGFLPLNRDKTMSKLHQLSTKYKMPVRWDLTIEELSVGEQQRIEILKLLYKNLDLLIFDEPTALLSPQESDLFLDQLIELKKTGKTIVLISHKLKEVFKVSDQITVFRKGKLVQTYTTKNTNAEEIADAIIGEKNIELEIVDEKMGTGQHILTVRDLSYFKSPQEKLSQCSFFLRQKEIVGLIGIEGNGQVELYNILNQPEKYKNKTSGFVEYKDKNIFDYTQQQLADRGLQTLPMDRIKDGLMPSFSAMDNYLLANHTDMTFSNRFTINSSSLLNEMKAAYEHFDIQPKNPNLAIEKYSGGNQQKLVFARSLVRQPDLFIAAHPTRGVDIKTQKLIHQELLTLKSKGTTVFLISSDLDEVLKISDRVLVIYQGKIVGEFYYYDVNETRLGQLMTGGH